MKRALTIRFNSIHDMGNEKMNTLAVYKVLSSESSYFPALSVATNVI